MHAPVVYVEVDRTLARSVGTKRILIPAAIQRIRKLRVEGATLYLWSMGGAAYAQAIAMGLGLAELLRLIPKPTLIIDDQQVHDWRGLTYERPF